jgi:hypothetical protein
LVQRAERSQQRSAKAVTTRLRTFLTPFGLLCLLVIKNSFPGPLIASAVYTEPWRISKTGPLFVEFLGSFTKTFASNASNLMALENKIHINCVGG